MRHARARSLFVLAALLGACTAPSGLTENSASAELALRSALVDRPQTFVLASVERQTAAPFVVFDHTCGDTHWVTALRDSIRLGADGAFRRAIVLERSANGAPESVSLTVTTGRWQWVGAREPGYSAASPTISITSATENGRSLSAYRIRVRDGRTLVMNSGLGGSCPGSPNDGRSADFIFTRAE